MTIPAILLPVFVQVALIFVLLFWMAALRQVAVRRGDLRFQDAALGSPWTGRTAQVTNSFNNQFQLPTLFFVVVILALFTRKADLVFVVLEWLFVVFRVLHAAIHVGPNVVRVRGPVWGLSSFVLLIMWIWFALHILSGSRSVKPGARAAAAIAVLAEVEAHHRPVAAALKDWGRDHRFAGSGDRAAIASLVYDALRRRASSAWRLGADVPRTWVLGALAFARGQDAAAIDALFADSSHGPEPLHDDERAAIAGSSLAGAPAWVAGDYPEWLDAMLARSLGEERAAEGAALAERAPLDLRVNALKGDRAKAAKALGHLGATEAPLSPAGLRLPLLADGRGPPVQAEPAFLKGLIEVQDEGSQLAAFLAAAEPGTQVVDFCAGAGGKTLALAAAMANRGQLYAYDEDLRRLAPLYERARRAGVRNLQIRAPRGTVDVLSDLAGAADLVLVDAPCTGTGTWRRNPDAKWRLRPYALEERMREQDAVLAAAARLVTPGGRLVYVTCSLLAEENEDRIAALCAAHAEFAPVPAVEVAAAAGLPALASFATAAGDAIRLTPRRTGTDGFFVTVLRREAPPLAGGGVLA